MAIRILRLKALENGFPRHRCAHRFLGMTGLKASSSIVRWVLGQNPMLAMGVDKGRCSPQAGIRHFIAITIG